MKAFDLSASDENIFNTFLSDKIGRNSELFYFVSLLNSIDDSFSIALDGHWGSGKTFFVKQAKMILDAYNSHIGTLNNSEQIKAIFLASAPRQKQSIEIEPQLSVYYDAWMNDNDSDPILSLVYQIVNTVKAEFVVDRSTDYFKLAATFLDFFKGTNISSIFDLLSSPDPLATIEQQKDVHTAVEEFLDSLLAERGNRLIIFIDELDRCTPIFTVKMLERIKHYFSNDRITFVFSVNIESLQHTIKKFYGENFDATRYLDRFFDLTISLPSASYKSYSEQYGLGDHNILGRLCNAIIKKYNMQLREISKFYGALNSTVLPYLNNTEFYSLLRDEDKTRYFCMLFIVPIVFAIKMVDHRLYTEFISGNKCDLFHEFLTDDILSRYKNIFLNANESYSNIGNNGAKVVNLFDKITEIYNAVFVETYKQGIYYQEIGSLYFNADTLSTLLKDASALSDCANYN